MEPVVESGSFRTYFFIFNVVVAVLDLYFFLVFLFFPGLILNVILEVIVDVFLDVFFYDLLGVVLYILLYVVDDCVLFVLIDVIVEFGL